MPCQSKIYLTNRLVQANVNRRGLLTFTIHGIFAAIFRSVGVIIRPNRITIAPHYALSEQNISHKSTRSGKRQQALVLKFHEGPLLGLKLGHHSFEYTSHF